MTDEWRKSPVDPRSGVFLGLGSGIGLVVASMVGAGVFLSAGFMAQELSAGLILVAWGVGALLAMAGARTYVVDRGLHPVPRGAGGEFAIAGVGLARGYLGAPAASA